MVIYREKLIGVFVSVLVNLLWASSSNAQEWDNAWKTMDRQIPLFQEDEYEEMDILMRPCVDHAKDSFPDAARRFEAGLPKGAYFLVIAGQSDPYVYRDSIHILVRSVSDSQIKGRASDRAHDHKRKRITVPISRVGDWVIVYPNRPEEGNWRHKYALLRQDGLVSGNCDPSHPEFQHFRLFRNSYSFVPPAGPNWQLRGSHVTRDGSIKVDMWMQEKGSTPNELNTLAAETWGNTYKFETDQDLVDLVTETDKADIGEDERFTLLQHSVTAYRGLEARCALSRRLVQDSQALLSSSGNRGPMNRDTFMLGCVHPLSEKIYVVLTYSHRYSPSHSAPEFAQQAEDVFQSLSFPSLDLDEIPKYSR